MQSFSDQMKATTLNLDQLTAAVLISIVLLLNCNVPAGFREADELCVHPNIYDD